MGKNQNSKITQNERVRSIVQLTNLVDQFSQKPKKCRKTEEKEEQANTSFYLVKNQLDSYIPGKETP